MADQRVPYTLADGTVVPSVTEILSAVPKPGLDRWHNYMGRMMIDTEVYVRSLANGGTLLHLAIEAAIRGQEFDKGLLVDFTPAEQDWARTSYRQFKAWYAEHDVEPLLMEHRMVSEEMRCGGTLDLYAQVDGRFTVMDWKSSAQVRNTHLFQVAAYRAMLEESGSGVDEVRVLSFPRTGKTWTEHVIVDTSEHLEVFKAALSLYRLLESKGGTKSKR